MMALAAMVAGGNGQSLSNTGLATLEKTTHGPPAVKEDAEPATGERGVEDETCALYGDTMFALTAMCRERKWVLAVDHAETCLGEGMDRFVLTMGASAGDGGDDGGSNSGHKGEWIGTAPRRPCSHRRQAATMPVRSLSPAIPFFSQLHHHHHHYHHHRRHHHHHHDRIPARRCSHRRASTLHPLLLPAAPRRARPCHHLSRGRSDRVLHRPRR